MKNCPKCNAAVDDNAVFCTACGEKLVADAPAAEPQQAPVQQQPPVQQQAPQYAPPVYAPQPYVDPYDHTAEFDAKDISDNKVFAMAVYLLGAVGIIIALLAARDSKYVAFHLRQAMKFVIIELLTLVCMAILAITVIVPIAGLVFLAVLSVIEIICFFQVCGNKAKEPVIIRSFTFLK